ncbi:MAG: hypothetical protein ACRDBM_03485 [Sporomusa sp.]
MKYRKKPVVIDAIQWDGTNLSEIEEFFGEDLKDFEVITWLGASDVVMKIHTLEGVHNCSRGDYIIKGVAGEFYPCKPDIFHDTYELAE